MLNIESNRAHRPIQCYKTEVQVCRERDDQLRRARGSRKHDALTFLQAAGSCNNFEACAALSCIEENGDALNNNNQKIQ